LRAELIRKWEPWKKSTGPKTPQRKARSAVRGYKGGTRDKVRELARLMRMDDGCDPFEVYEQMERMIDELYPAK
jgi:hypothetical protein